MISTLRVAPNPKGPQVLRQLVSLYTPEIPTSFSFWSGDFSVPKLSNHNMKEVPIWKKPNNCRKYLTPGNRPVSG